MLVRLLNRTSVGGLSELVLSTSDTQIDMYKMRELENALKVILLFAYYR